MMYYFVLGIATIYVLSFFIFIVLIANEVFSVPDDAARIDVADPTASALDPQQSSRA